MAREPFNRLWAENPEQFEEPESSVWERGWEGGADKNPPIAAQENWWHNRADIALRAIERLGAMTWHPDAEYVQGAISVGSDGEKYISTSGDDGLPNIGNDPSVDDGTNWIVYYGGGAPGMISYFASSSPPPGWLKADGSEISRSQYSRLWSFAQNSGNISADEISKLDGQFGPGDGISTFSIPDARGEFIRSWDDGKGVDPSRGIGTSQDDQNLSHSHQYTRPSEAVEVQSGAGATVVRSQQNFQTSQEGGSESRPRNISFLACIKY